MAHISQDTQTAEVKAHEHFNTLRIGNSAIVGAAVGATIGEALGGPMGAVIGGALVAVLNTVASNVHPSATISSRRAMREDSATRQASREDRAE